MNENETQDRVEADIDELDDKESTEPSTGDAQTEVAVESERAETPDDNTGEEESGPEDELETLRAEAAANYDRYLRVAAEMDNYRKRTVRMRAETREETLRDILLQIAPILDNMYRALGQETQDADSLKQGVELICGQFNEVLKGYGLVEIEAVGQPFDPNMHEALAEVASSEYAPGTIIEEVEKGYKLNDKVVRPSRVAVSKVSEGD